MGGDFIGWSHLTTVFSCTPSSKQLLGGPDLEEMVLEEISSLLLLSAEVLEDAARLEGLNIQLGFLVFFFLETLSGPSLHDSVLALMVSWPCPSI